MAKHSRSPSDDDEKRPSRGAKRRASIATKPPPCTAASTPPPWADLSYGPAGLIAERELANDVSGYMSFRGVCRAWRRGTPRPRAPHGWLADRRFYPHRWIMLREAAPPGPARHRRRFLNVCTGRCVRTELPELEGHHLLGATSEGLLALLDKATYVVRLLNPATTQLAELPTLDPLLPPEARAKISKDGLAYALEVTGLGLVGDDCTLAISFFTPTMLVVARPGDGHWTLVDDRKRFHSAMSFSGRFYCAKAGAVMALDRFEAATNLQTPPPPRLVQVAAITCKVSPMCMDTVHLVECDGRLLLLRRWLQRRGEDRWIRGYKAYAVNLAARKTVPIRGLPGRRAVFLGKTRALSIPSRVFPSIHANKVYPAADSWEMSKDGVGSYSLLNRRIEWCNVRTRRNDDDDDNGWTRPCSIREYLSWYVSCRCNDIEPGSDDEPLSW